MYDPNRLGAGDYFEDMEDGSSRRVVEKKKKKKKKKKKGLFQGKTHLPKLIQVLLLVTYASLDAFLP